jgi:hypothetical protein
MSSFFGILPRHFMWPGKMSAFLIKKCLKFIGLLSIKNESLKNGSKKAVETAKLPEFSYL